MHKNRLCVLQVVLILCGLDGLGLGSLWAPIVMSPWVLLPFRKKKEREREHQQEVQLV